MMTGAACGGSPTSPTNGSIASVTLAASSVAAGANVQGTVTLSSAAGTGGLTVGLSSSNPAIATVQASVDIPSGSTTGTFPVWGVASGSVTITASLNGASRQSSSLSVSPTTQLASLTVNPATVVGGTNATATATLTGPAPPAGASVTLASDGTAIVPASVMVVSGSTSATFNVLTQVVSAPVNATITASYGGKSAMAVIALTRAGTATASFGVTGKDVTETCAVINGGTALDCTFNGSTSNAPGNIVAYDWTWAVSGAPKTQTTTGAQLATPSFSCSMLPSPPIPASGALTMIVTLKIHDDQGNVSPIVTDNGVRLLPQGSCGY
jgi:hypothetical protein